MSSGAAPAKPSLGKQVGNFAIGGLSGMVATCCIQPLDIIKVRIQLLAGENPNAKFGPFGVGKNIMQNEGIKGFYKGLDSALARQIVYTTARFGIFLNLSDYVKSQVYHGANLSFGQKGLCSLAAGGIGSMFGTPTDLMLIRMQTDGNLPPEQRRNYKSVFDAARRIPKEEGVLSLWKGGFPTVIRAMALNCGMFTTYEEAKERLTRAFPQNKGAAWFAASVLAGATAATMSLPFDNAKTKLQAQKPNPDGTLPYKNIFDAMSKTVKAQGVSGLWVSLPTYIIRIAPHAMISLIVAENLKKAIFGA